MAERVKDPRSRDSGNTLLMKELSGGVLVMTGANSAGVALHAGALPALDEIDAYPGGDAGGEGDPVDLVVQRAPQHSQTAKSTCAQRRRSSDFSRIEAAYQESDRRVFEVPQDQCGACSVIYWKDIRWPEGKIEEASWHCPHCEHVHPEFRNRLCWRGVRGDQQLYGDGKLPVSGCRVCIRRG